MPRPKSPAKDNASHGEREGGKSAALVNLNLHAKKKKRLCFSFVCVAHLSCIARQLRLLRLLRHLLLLPPMHGNYLICVCPKKKKQCKNFSSATSHKNANAVSNFFHFAGAHTVRIRDAFVHRCGKCNG